MHEPTAANRNPHRMEYSNQHFRRSSPRLRKPSAAVSQYVPGEVRLGVGLNRLLVIWNCHVGCTLAPVDLIREKYVGGLEAGRETGSVGGCVLYWVETLW